MADRIQFAPWSKIFPFSRDHQLNYDLNHDLKTNTESNNELEGDKRGENKHCESSSRRYGKPLDHLPGYPRVKLKEASKLFKFLVREFCNDDMDMVAPRLWWMSKQDKSNVSPLHRQKVKGREIIITEDSKLHLVWIDDRIFIKPLPKYILSYAFWETYLDNGIEGMEQHQGRIRKAALGYLRTWLYLVKYESDFRIAKDLGLIPEGTQWDKFCDFTSDFEDIPDSDVNERYAYGEIRLTRLNLYAPITIRKQYFQRVTYQYGAYFAQFYAPILFIFGVLSIGLNGMQVAISAEQVAPSGNTLPLMRVSLWFGVLTIISSTILALSLVFLWVYKVVNEWRFALKDHYRNSKPDKVGPSKV